KPICGRAVNQSVIRVGATERRASFAGSLAFSSVCARATDGTSATSNNARHTDERRATTVECDMGVEDDTAVSSRQPRHAAHPTRRPTTILPALGPGTAMGMRHATDADHVAAISTIATENRSAKRAALIGVWWGAGHSTSVLLVGGALVLLRLPMPPR